MSFRYINNFTIDKKCTQSFLTLHVLTEQCLIKVNNAPSLNYSKLVNGPWPTRRKIKHLVTLYISKCTREYAIFIVANPRGGGGAQEAPPSYILFTYVLFN